jgi:hypothetical protein
MTETQKNAISSPPTGLVIYQTDGSTGLYYNFGTPASPQWNKVTDNTTPQGYWIQDGTLIYYNSGNVGIGTATPSALLDVDGSARITGALQLTNGAASGYVLSSDASGNASWSHVSAVVPNDADWEVDGNDMYSIPTGNVGIGTATPGAKLHVDGASHLINDSVYISGRPGKLFIDAETGYEPTLRFGYDGTALFRQYIFEPGTAPYFTIAAAPYEEQWGINPLGAVWHEYYGTSQSAYRINSSAATSNLTLVNDNATGGRGINVSMSNISNTSDVLGIASFGYGLASAIYGGNPTQGRFAHIASQYAGVSGYYAVGDNWGRLGASQFGVFGANVNDYWGAIGADDPLVSNDEYGVYGDDGAEPDPKYGGLGTSNHGAYGKHTNQHWGALGTANYGAYGENDDGSIGVLGDDGQGVYGRSGETDYHWGAIGVDGGGTNTDYGVYGSANGSNPNFGGIGTDNYGVYGEYNTKDFIGALGAIDCGVYGYLGGSSQSLSDGDYAIIGRGVENPGESGSGYGRTESIGGVKGYNNPGVSYGFGVSGYTTTAGNRTGGVLGYLNNTNWGSLGYRDNSGTNYGAYFTAAAGTGSGKSQTSPASDIGLGVYGDLFGAHINGNVYGLYVSGENYGIYANGDVYRTGADVHLQTDMSGQNNVMYTLVSTEMTVQTYGIGQLQNGKSNIAFDDAFASVLSSAEPVIVTITPIGECKGVYLDRVDDKGFVVAENNNGKSNVQFSWIAIGKRQGYENMTLPADVIAADYTQKIQRGLANDNDEGIQAEGLYYQDGKLYNGSVMAGKAASNVNAVLHKSLDPLSAERNGINIPDAKRITRNADSGQKEEVIKPVEEEKRTSDSELIRK